MRLRLSFPVALASLLLAGAASADDLPPEADSTVVGIVAFRYAWVTQYPGPDGKLGRFSDSLVTEANPHGRDFEDPAGKDDILAIGREIVVPADRPVIVHGTSADYLHAFGVKALKLEEPLVPGTMRTFSFKPAKPGKMAVLCSTYCGEEHDKMKGTLRLLPRAEFDAWLAAQAKAPAP